MLVEEGGVGPAQGMEFRRLGLRKGSRMLLSVFPGSLTF